VLLVPAWDFVVDDELHLRMATLRGIEGGFTVVRAAQQGLLTVTDSRGEVLARAGRGSEPDAELVTVAPWGAGPTPYARHGDLFAWACAVAAAALLSAAALRRRREVTVPQKIVIDKTQ
jgi:apolipoprotein N-acyltransferase